MTRKKRPYIPKVKGCYECSQRRIDCDGTRPRCVKCTSKGIACSGFGPRFRFLDGFSTRRRKALIEPIPGTAHDLFAVVQPPTGIPSSPSPPYPLSYSSSLSALPTSSSSSSSFSSSPSISSSVPCSSSVLLSNILFESDETRPRRGPGSYPAVDPDVICSETDDNVTAAYVIDDQDELANRYNEAALPGSDCVEAFGDLLAQVDDGSEDDTESTGSHEAMTLAQARKLSLLLVDLSLFDPWKEFLLLYCRFMPPLPSRNQVANSPHVSENIAAEMVVVDDRFNGWRHLILPIACSNEMVMDAVMTVSSYHLAGRTAGQPVADASRLYARAIDHLLSRKDLVEWDPETRQHVILAIVVLLVAAMVNGMPDFPIVFQMLQSALDAVGGEDQLAKGGDLGTFLLRQIHKLNIYAAPLISQSAGTYAITHHANENFECLYYYHRLYPDQSATFDRIVSLRQQAFAMYLNRVCESQGLPPSQTQSGSVELFQSCLELFTEGSLGEHVLVWPAFIAALESRTPEQQHYFSQFLRRQYYRNGFANILRALELLDTLWTDSERMEDWPAVLPELRVFIM